MSTEDYNKLADIIGQVTGVDKLEINENYNLIEAGVTSITFIKLIIAIENVFLFEFKDEDLDIFKLQTVKNLIEYIDINRKNE